MSSPSASPLLSAAAPAARGPTPRHTSGDKQPDAVGLADGDYREVDENSKTERKLERSIVFLPKSYEV